MKILVCIKTVTGAAVNAEDAFQRGGRVGPSVLGPSDAHAVEAALQLVEQAGQGDVVIAALAPAEALGAVREAMALGAHRGVMLSDPLLQKADLLAVSRALAALVEHERADLYLTCSWSGDIDGTMLWAAVAERLKLPVLTQARSLTVADGMATIQRQIEAGDLTLAAPLPCLIEVTETINKPRYPTMKGKQAAKSKPLQIIRLADLGIAPEGVGDAGVGTKILSLGKPPARREPIVVDDAARAPERIVAFLEARNLI
jgi:electron transfer flavoprotein beta subunit